MTTATIEAPPASPAPAQPTRKAKDRPSGTAKMLRFGDLRVVEGFNPRTLLEEQALADLTVSVTEHGVLEALGVSPLPDGTFQVVSGHRRYAACVRAGFKPTDLVPVTIRETDDTDRLVNAYEANQHREDLSPLDDALTFARLRAGGLTQKGIAEKLKISEKLVSDRLVIADLPEDLRELFRSDWPTSAARPLKRLVDIGDRGEQLARRVITALHDTDGTFGYYLAHRGPADFASHPFDIISHVAQDMPDSQAITVQASHNGAGGGFHVPDVHYGGIGGGINPERLGKALSSDTRQLIAAMHGGRKAGDYYRYRIHVDQAVVDALMAAQVAIPNRTDGSPSVVVCLDLDLLATLVEPIVQADHKRWTKAIAKQKRSQGTTGGQEKADEKAREAAEALQARDFNLRLGENLSDLLETDLNMDVARFLVYTMLQGHTYGSSQSTVMQLALRGLRYVLPQWQQVIEVKSTGGTRVRYPGEGTKNPTGQDTPADQPPVDLLTDWLDLATTPKQLIGRAIVIYAAAMHAKEEAVPKSRRTHGFTPLTQTNTFGQRAAIALAAIVDGKIPDAEAKPKKKTSRRGKPKTAEKPAAEQLVAAAGANQKAKRATRGAASTADKALAAITETPGITIPDLAEKLGIKQNGLYRVLPALQKDGKITKTGRGWHPAEETAG